MKKNKRLSLFVFPLSTMVVASSFLLVPTINGTKSDNSKISKTQQTKTINYQQQNPQYETLYSNEMQVYQVSSWEDIMALNTSRPNKSEFIVVELTSDIDLSSINNLVPSSYHIDSVKNVYVQGNGHSIKNRDFNQSEITINDDLYMIGIMENVIFENVSFDGVEFFASNYIIDQSFLTSTFDSSILEQGIIFQNVTIKNMDIENKGIYFDEANLTDWYSYSTNQSRFYGAGQDVLGLFISTLQIAHPANTNSYISYVNGFTLENNTFSSNIIYADDYNVSYTFSLFAGTLVFSFDQPYDPVSIFSMNDVIVQNNSVTDQTIRLSESTMSVNVIQSLVFGYSFVFHHSLDGEIQINGYFSLNNIIQNPIIKSELPSSNFKTTQTATEFLGSVLPTGVGGYKYVFLTELNNIYISNDFLILDEQLSFEPLNFANLDGTVGVVGNDHSGNNNQSGLDKSNNINVNYDQELFPGVNLDPSKYIFEIGYENPSSITFSNDSGKNSNFSNSILQLVGMNQFILTYDQNNGYLVSMSVAPSKDYYWFNFNPDTMISTLSYVPYGQRNVESFNSNLNVQMEIQSNDQIFVIEASDVNVDPTIGTYYTTMNFNFSDYFNSKKMFLKTQTIEQATQNDTFKIIINNNITRANESTRSYSLTASEIFSTNEEVYIASVVKPLTFSLSMFLIVLLFFAILFILIYTLRRTRKIQSVNSDYAYNEASYFNYYDEYEYENNWESSNDEQYSLEDETYYDYAYDYEYDYEY